MQMSKKVALVESLIHESIFNFASRHHYDADFLKLFSGTRKKTNEKISQDLKSKMDWRSKEEYHKNIALGWIIEDYLIDLSNGKFKPYGCDAERKFLTKGITNVGDLVTEDGTVYEVVADFHGLKWNQINLRHNKLMHLREVNANIIIVDVINQKFFIKPIRKFPFYKLESFAGYGGKEAYRIFLNEDIHNFKPINQICG